MTIQQQLATRLYELLPHKKRCTVSGCMGIPCRDSEHFDTIRLADILLAIKPYKIKLEFDTRSGSFLFITDWKDKTVIFDLSKDNILDQSNELCKFALEVLK